VLLGYLLAAPLLRLAVRFFWKEQLPMVSDWTFTALDSIAVGCLLALLASEPGVCQRLLATRKQAAALGAATLVILIGSLVLGVRFYLYQIAFGCTINAFCIAVLIWLAITHRESVVGRFLNCKRCVFVGTLSYSLYLWQQPFLNPHSAAWPCRWPINLVLAVGAALLSYFLVELPFLRLKKRVAH
jgi:peptidoglycan/LPS O-acetylase OafA/YrhL